MQYSPPKNASQRDDKLPIDNFSTRMMRTDTNVQTSAGENGATVMAAIGDITLLPFFKVQPDLWFLQAEARFRSKAIESDQTKFNTVTSSSDSEILQYISDIVCSPPEREKCNCVKFNLIKRLIKR